MSGVLPGIALINNFDGNGELMRGALLRIYQAGTNTPVTAYKDIGLTAGQEHPWPIPADSAARLPMFYLADGNYRVRLSSTDGGYVAYDIPIMASVGPSTGGGGGGGVSPEVIFQTGYLLPFLGSGVRSGFVRLNGRTIGSSGSGATERANADCQSLYEYLYGEFDDTVCPVIGGRGAGATADFNANKPITLIDARGRTLFGADGMGGGRANRLTTATFATPDTIGTSGGTEAHTLTQAELPAVTLDFTGDAQTVTVTSTVADVARGNTTFSTNGGSFFFNTPATVATITSTGSITPTGTIETLGSGNAHGTVSPGVIVTIYVKL